MPEPATVHARVRGHLENIEREIGHCAYALADAPEESRSEVCIRRLLLINALVGETLAALAPPAPTTSPATP